MENHLEFNKIFETANRLSHSYQFFIKKIFLLPISDFKLLSHFDFLAADI